MATDEAHDGGEGRLLDATVYPEEAKQIRILLDGAEIHGLLEALMARLDEHELDQVHWSLACLVCTTEPFGEVDDATLVKLLSIPEAWELTMRVAEAKRLILSLSCAVALEADRRVRGSRGDGPHG